MGRGPIVFSKRRGTSADEAQALIDAEGLTRPVVVPLLAGTWGITDMSASLTEFASFFRTQFDFSGYSQVRLVASLNVAGATNAEVRVQYSTDQSSWSYLDGATGPSANMNGTGPRTGAWVNLAAGAKADVFLRMISINGDGVADPSFRLVMLHAR